jgi:hypothetical protein
MKAGDWIVCVDARFAERPPYNLRLGGIYQIDYVIALENRAEIVIKNSLVYWKALRFRPLHSSKLTDLECFIYGVP